MIPKVSIACRALAVLLAISVAVASAADNALTSPPRISLHELGYIARNWTVENGLPRDNVLSVAQTSDGYLWIGSDMGPARFDGLRFHLFDRWHNPELRDRVARRLLADVADGLWICSWSGDITRWENDVLKRFPQLSPPQFSAEALATDSRGNLFLLGSKGAVLSRWNGSALQVVATNAEAGTIQTLVVDAHDEPWCQVNQRVFHVIDGKFLDATAQGGTGNIFRRFYGTLAKLNGTALLEHRSNAWQTVRTFAPVFAVGQPEHTVEDQMGIIWFSWLDRLCASLPDGRVALVEVPGHNIGRVQQILRDREGNIWLATDPDGLFRLSFSTFQSVTRETGLASRRVVAACGDDAGAWVTSGNRIHRVSVTNRASRMIATNNIYSRSLAPARDGGCWAVERPGRLLKVSVDGSVKVLTTVPNLPEFMFEGRDGILWLHDRRGLIRWDGKSLTPETVNTALAPEFMTEDARGTLYLLAANGIFRRNSGGWERVTEENDGISKRVNAFAVDDDGAIWAAVEHPALARLKNGKWFTFESDDAFPLTAEAIALDGRGGLWLSTDRGPGRFDLAALNQWAEGEPEVNGVWFDRDDGLGSIECSNLPNSLSKTREGKLWFATANGVSVVDIERLLKQAEHFRPPPVHIEEVLIDDKPVKTGDALAVPPGVHRVEFRFTGLELSAPEKSTFAFRLAGFDKDWVKAGTRRAAYYQKVPPGQYRFDVIGANKHQVWNREGASVAVTVRPAWWQTNAARAGFGVAAFGLLALGYSWRVNRLKREQALHDEFTRKLISSQEEERKRIAGELHDSLGQNLLIVKNRLYLAGEQAATGSVPTHLDELNDVVTEAIGEVRQISLNLRPYQLERLGLTKSLQSTVRKISEATRMNIATDIETVDGLFAQPDEIHFFRIVQEGLNNVVKHADASAILLSVRRASSHVIVRLEDDGRGFDYSGLMNDPKRPRGLGLSGLTERARILGGTFRCESAPGAGTRLTIEIPVVNNNGSGN